MTPVIETWGLSVTDDGTCVAQRRVASSTTTTAPFLFNSRDTLSRA